MTKQGHPRSGSARKWLKVGRPKTVITNKLVVFVKAPIPGQVKTRLCPPLDVRQAAELYVAFVKDTLAAIRKVTGVEVEIAYAASASHPDLGWLEGKVLVPFFLQHGADLGNRLTNAFEHTFKSGVKKVVIIGSDTPHLDPKDISEAFNLLDYRDVVLGPAKDGGYYLIGLNNPNPLLFNDISWSSSQVFERTLERINHQKLSLGLLPSDLDIDTPTDLEVLERLSQNGYASQLRFTSQVLGNFKANLDLQ